MSPDIAGYFEKHVAKDTYLVFDRSSNHEIVSVAATGFGMYCWALEATKGKLDKNTALFRINKAFDATIKANPIKNRGWLYHFTDSHGYPTRTTTSAEVSTIDSAIFYFGARKAALLLDSPELQSKVEKAIAAVDINWLLTKKNNITYFCHGLHWREEIPEFIPYVWEDFSEGFILYRLFNVPYAPQRIMFNLPLFVYYYPLCFIQDEEELVMLLKLAIQWQKKTYGYWGKTACDGPNGYNVNEKDIISPIAILTLSKITNNSQELYLPVPADTQSYNIVTNWCSSDQLGIDMGSCYILLNQK